MTAARIAMVTGANQGIGFALVEGLAARMNADDLVLLTGRDAQRVADTQPGRGPGTRRHRRRRGGPAGR
jgi:NAD(P)-dependent dehydrogenase (short-subunit alcohol dehydrogenase family)